MWLGARQVRAEGSWICCGSHSGTKQVWSVWDPGAHPWGAEHAAPGQLGLHKPAQALGSAVPADRWGGSQALGPQAPCQLLNQVDQE